MVTQSGAKPQEVEKQRGPVREPEGEAANTARGRLAPTLLLPRVEQGRKVDLGRQLSIPGEISSTR